MKVAYTISGLGHAAVLLWSIWSLAAKPLPAPPPEALPVDLVSVSDFTRMTAGSKDAPRAATPQPVAEKIEQPKPVEDATAKVVEKKEVKAAREPPPAPQPKPVQQEPDKPKADKPKSQKKATTTKKTKSAPKKTKGEGKKTEGKAEKKGQEGK